VTRVAVATVLAGVAGAACSAGPALLLSGRAWGLSPLSRAASLAGRARSRLPIRATALPPGLATRNWLSLKLASAAIALLLALPFAAATWSRLALALTACAAAAGFVLPDVWLARQRRRRDEAVLRALPDMLDLLRVTVEAGLAPARGLGVVAAEFRGPLAMEWGRVAAEVALGVPQEEALAGLRRRLPDEETASFVETLSRSRRHGVPLGTALAGQATRARHRRRQQLRERAARAGPKIQLAVALLMVPSVLLLVAAALMAELQQSGLGFGT
jgi:tight adherence protein C